VPKPSRPTRKVSTARQKFTIQVFSEGVKTEVQYLKAWYRRYREGVIVNIDPRDCGRGPLQLVEEAVAAKERASKEQRRGRGRAPDVYWCVFDVDEHPNIPEAIALADANEIRVAISNPCIELWLLLHYVDHRKWDHRWDVQAALREAAGIGKNLTTEQTEELLERYEVARNRAVALKKMHEENDTEDPNPSSNLHELIDMIKEPHKPTA